MSNLLKIFNPLGHVRPIVVQPKIQVSQQVSGATAENLYLF